MTATQLHTELAQLRARFSEQYRSLRPTIIADDDSASPAAIAWEALCNVLAMYDWSPEARERAADYCGVDTSAAGMVQAVTSMCYRGKR